ncbi:MAG TPA: ribonuclease H family protein [Bacillota bacterium]|nr:ribonuclease H family protein [Bacillota bacterium]
MAKKKFYVVWKGRKPGIYTSWDACKEQVHGFQGAEYKAFPTKEEAETAFSNRGPMTRPTSGKKIAGSSKDYEKDSISVDAACSGNPGDMEYQGVWTGTGEPIFHHGPVEFGTNNIGEFLAVVHALALLDQQGKYDIPIYSDSMTALAWVRNKQANTSIERSEKTEEIWNLIHRAEQWLRSHEVRNPLLKWETKQWGESKADFGRK